MQSKVCLKVGKKGLSQTVYTDTTCRLFHYVSHLWQIITMLLTEPMPDPREGQKGHMPPSPPEATSRHTLHLEKRSYYWPYNSKSVMR